MSKELNDFSWDEISDDIFSEEAVGSDEEININDLSKSKEEVKTETEDGVENNSTKVEAEETEKVEVDFSFEGIENEYSENEEYNDETPITKIEDDDPEFYKSLFNDLREAEVFSFDLKEDEEINSGNFHEIMDKEIDTRMEEAISEFMEEVGEEGQHFLAFVKEGGTSEEWFNKRSQLATSENDDVFMRQQLAAQGFDDEEIQDQIEYWKEKDKYESKLKVFRNKDKKAKLKAEKEYIKKQEELRKSQEKARKEYTKTIKSQMSEMDDFNGFPITKKDKRQLNDYLFKASVKLDNGTNLTGFQNQLKEAMNDPKKLVGLATLLMNDFDFSSLDRKKETEIVKKTRSKIHKSKTKPRIKGQSLADRFL